MEVEAKILELREKKSGQLKIARMIEVGTETETVQHVIHEAV